MDLDDVDFATLEDPAPKAKSTDGAPAVSSGSASKKGLKRRLLYRADVNPDGRRYKGRKVTRAGAELDRQTLGLLDDNSEEEQDADDDVDGSVEGEADGGRAPSAPATADNVHGSDDDSDSDGSEFQGDPDLFVVDENASSDGDGDGDAEGGSDEHEDADASSEDASDEGDDTSIAEKNEPHPSANRHKSILDEERAITQRLNEVKQKDEQRAAAVKQQMTAYDAIMGLRIRMEPLLKTVKTLPTREQRDDLSGEADVDDTRADVEAQLNKLISTTQKELDRLWPGGALDGKQADDQFAEWRDNVVDRWNRKLNEASGKAPKGGFKVLDMSVSSAIRSNLESGKPLEKVQRVKEPLKLVGGAVIAPGQWEHHFDDEELYRNLLRDVIESGDDAERSLQLSKANKSGRGKKRRDVSFAKGKRLKYDVMDKLVGFLAPVPAPDPGPVDEILANLFGKQGVVKPVDV